MKKLILILSIFAINTFAVDCVRETFNFYLMQIAIYDSDYNGVRLDSMYVDKGSSFYSTKEYWTGNHRDSVVEYIKSSDSEEWEEHISLMDRNFSVIQEGNLKKYTLTDNGEVYGEYVAFYDNDSLYYTDAEHEDYDTIYIRNDTLHRNNGELIIVRDPEDESKCYEKEGENIWNLYEYETKGDTLIQKKTSADEEKTFIIFMVPVDSNSTTTIQRKVRPTINYKKAKHFDLLGRPAMGKYTVEFLK